MYQQITFNLALKPGTTSDEAQHVREQLLRMILDEADRLGQSNAVIGSSIEPLDDKD